MNIKEAKQSLDKVIDKAIKFLGRTSTSSARYQDNIFNDNAVPPNVLETSQNEQNKIVGDLNLLGKENYFKFL